MIDARPTDVLANERTFLAYIRTALAFVAFGFVIARFALFTIEFGTVLKVSETGHGLSTAFGTVMALLGSAVAAYGAYRYVVIARALDANRPAHSAPIAAIAGAAAVVLIGVVVGFGLVEIR